MTIIQVPVNRTKKPKSVEWDLVNWAPHGSVGGERKAAAGNDIKAGLSLSFWKIQFPS